MILLISRSRRLANQYSEIFHFMGMLNTVATPPEALKEISSLYRAALIIEPEALLFPADFVRRLCAHVSIPIFAISADGERDKYAYLFAACFRDTCYSGTVVAAIADYCKSNNCSHVGEYSLLGLNAAPDLPSPRYYGKALPLTKTESMILRYLIRTYPHPQKTAKILKYAYRPSRRPEPSSVRTHICLMNRKFRELTGRNLIGSVADRGYTVITDERENGKILV